MFYHSYNLDKIAQDKVDSIPGGTSQLRKLAANTLSCGNHSLVITHIKSLQDMGYLSQEDVTMVSIPNFILFFHMNFETTEKFIEEWEPKKKAKVPDSVLTKMIFGRLQQLDNMIKESNTTVMRYRENGNMNQNIFYTEYGILENPEFHTVANFNVWADKHIVNKSVRSFLGMEAVSWLKKFKKQVFSKPELNDEVFASAMNLLISSRIMNS